MTDVERCRRRGTQPIGFMSHTVPVCWLPAGHTGNHETIYGATIEHTGDGDE